MALNLLRESRSPLEKESPLNEEIKSKEISQTKAPTLKEFMNKPVSVKKNSLGKSKLILFEC
jgi:hypothetical protein